MSAKTIVKIPVVLTRAVLLQLIRSETVEYRGNAPDATMIEGIAKISLHAGLTDGERRAICDVLTSDVMREYSHGYSVSSWANHQPVAGTTAWLTMIASNADRIPIEVQTEFNTWTTTYLADATPEQQKKAIRDWLAAGIMPVWERHVPFKKQEKQEKQEKGKDSDSHGR